MAEVTQILQAIDRGDASAASDLLPLVYDELRRIAGRAFRGERSDHTLGTTGLVHEAYLRLADQSRLEYRDRVHFYAVAARAMRRILVDHARRHRAVKRGGGRPVIALDEAVGCGRIQRGDLILLVVFGAGLTWAAAVIEW